MSKKSILLIIVVLLVGIIGAGALYYVVQQRGAGVHDFASCATAGYEVVDLNCKGCGKECIASGGTTYRQYPERMDNAEAVCRYIQNDPEERHLVGAPQLVFQKCNNYVCSGSDTGPYWDIQYRCPGPPSFPLGQTYSIHFDEGTGDIKVLGMTN